MVGISGGEPLAEREALCTVVSELAGHTKLVLFTSGLPWIGGREAPWASELLADIDTCVVSHSPFHERAIGRDDYLLPVVEHILARGCDVQIHALLEAAALSALQTQVRSVRPVASGARPPGEVYVVPIPLLSAGRAARFQLTRPHKPLAEWGPCSLVTAPVLRTDGHMIGCCNETLTRYPDDPALTWPVQSGDELVERFRAHARSRLSQRLRTRGPMGLLEELSDQTRQQLETREFDTICGACAAARELFHERPDSGTQSADTRTISHLPREATS